MTQQVSLSWPSNLMDEEAYTNALQKALSDLQGAVNSNATQASVLLLVPSSTNSTQQSTTSASYSTIPGWSWTINSQGGLVDIDAILAGTMQDQSPGQFALTIDGKIVLEATTHSLASGSTSNAAFQISLRWRVILGTGKHIISVQFLRQNAGTLTVNGNSRGNTSSSMSIIELGGNVQNLNVQAN